MNRFLNAPPSIYGWRNVAKWLIKVAAGVGSQVMANAMLGLLGVAASLAEVGAVKFAIDVAAHSTEGSLPLAVAMVGGLIAADFAVSIFRLWIRNTMGVKARNRMQQQLLNHLLCSEWKGRERWHSGDVINRLESDVATIIDFLTETIPDTLASLTLFCGAFLYLFSMDSRLALVVVAMLSLFVLASKCYFRKMRCLTRAVRESDSEVQSLLQESVQHRMLLLAFNAASTLLNRLSHVHERLRQRVARRTTFSILSNFLLNVGFALGYLLAFLWSAQRMYHHTLTFGGMTAFLQLVAKIQAPARSLTRLAPVIVATLTAAERLMELEESPLEESFEPEYMARPCGIRLENAAFRYADQPDKQQPTVINHLSTDFPPASFTAILGETGAGKTTLIRLLLALVRPTEGHIYIYNKVEKQALSPRHRCNLVYVPQGNTLLSGTIRDNLRLGCPSATDEDMQKALRTACADFVFQLPDGLDTYCSEVGGGLSEGQAQRIAIARGLLRDGCIMLLDEVTSALDADTEQRLLHNLMQLKGRTILFITHRTAVAQQCQRVLRMEKLNEVPL